MRVFDGEAYRDETPEEVEVRELWEKEQASNPPQPTMEERMAALEEENRLLKAALGVE